MAMARAFLARAREGNFLDTGHAPTDPEAMHGLVRGLLKQHAMRDQWAMQDVVRLADESWQDADLALRELIEEHARRNEPMPPVLTAYALKLIDPRHKQLGGAGGRSRATTRSRTS